MVTVARAVEKRLSAADPDHASAFANNARSLDES